MPPTQGIDHQIDFPFSICVYPLYYPLMKLPAMHAKRIAKAARQCKIKFILLFGSAVQSLTAARDVDIAVGPGRLTIRELSILHDALEKTFGKKVDLIQLGTPLSPVLVKEIARNSICLWEDPRGGREAYAILMDRLLAVAEDETLAFPKELKIESLTMRQRRLRVS